ncbi:protein TIC 22, chloroplastic [Selaginella moellendorffii]|nr:protein TIC 22, chloroplastic [Selaginella moellendorffii]|eukprot:XP_002966944.2 protein TIC 22, chloroplastic [Selaginella moellendorffii]
MVEGAAAASAGGEQSPLASLLSRFQRRLARAGYTAPPFPVQVIQAVERKIRQGLEVLAAPPRNVAAAASFACLSRGAAAFGAEAPGRHLYDLAMAPDQVSKRLDGVPVYTVSNHDNEFVLISDSNGHKSLGLFCFRHEDAEALLAQIRDREPGLGRGAKIVAVSLDKVYQLKTEGIAFRFLPDPLQVKHALESRAKTGDPGKAFDGVPVFQSDNLVLRSKNRRFCPIFFSKEDLERALLGAFKQQQKINPALKVNTDIQVGSFEDVLQRLESSDDGSGWGDVVFIPPGMDALSHFSEKVSAVG